MAGKILCIIDGATDEQYNIDPFLKPFHKGYFTTTPAGMETESKTCIMNLLGIKNIPQNSRAWFEALGERIPLRDDDLVLRTTMVKVDDEMIIKEISQRSDEIDLPGYYSLGAYKGILVERNKGLNEVIDFPVHKHMGEKLPENLNIEQHLSGEGIYLVPWAPSIRPKNLERISGFAVTGIPLVKGIAESVGMKYSDEEKFTGDVDTDLTGKVDMALEKAKTEDFVMLHINGTDEAAHRLDVYEKATFRDKAMRLVKERLLTSDNKVIVTSDHGTSPITGCHMNFKQPYYGNFDIRLKEDEGVREWLRQ